MKKNILLFGMLCAFLVSCGDKKSGDTMSGQDETTVTPTPEAPLTVTECYEMIKNKDTIQMTLKVTNGIAQGELIYKLNEKDSNTGTFTGTMEKDTLRAEYSFQSEGVMSIREVAFVRNTERDTVFVEGFGEVTMKGDTQHFKNPKQLKFDKNSIVLKRGKCY